MLHSSARSPSDEYGGLNSDHFGGFAMCGSELRCPKNAQGDARRSSSRGSVRMDQFDLLPSSRSSALFAESIAPACGLSISAKITRAFDAEMSGRRPAIDDKRARIHRQRLPQNDCDRAADVRFHRMGLAAPSTPPTRALPVEISSGWWRLR
jgi:hypothetical protein